MSYLEEIQVKNLDHLGIVAGLIDEIGIIPGLIGLIFIAIGLGSKTRAFLFIGTITFLVTAF